jgi:hypothetical protein
MSRYSEADRKLAIALYLAGETSGRIRSLFGNLGETTFRTWRADAGVPVQQTPRDEAAIARALEAYTQETGKALAVDGAPKIGQRTKIEPEKYVPSGRLYVCPEGCTCLGCQLKMPMSLERSSGHPTRERDRSEISPKRMHR